MNCAEVKELLSAYFDGELSMASREAVDAHLETCAACWVVLEEFGRLSQLADSLRTCAPAPSMGAVPPRATHLRPAQAHRSSRPLAVVAALAGLVALALFIAWQARPHAWSHHHHASTELGQYLLNFTANPGRAQEQLMAHHAGRDLTAAEASRKVKFPLVASNANPPGYRRESINVLDLPCCVCVQTVFVGDASHPVVVFEHTEKQEVWFSDLPAITTLCEGVPCKIVEIDQMLASTWTIGTHQVTVVGVRDLAELNTWMRQLQAPPPAP